MSFIHSQCVSLNSDIVAMREATAESVNRDYAREWHSTYVWFKINPKKATGSA